MNQVSAAYGVVFLLVVVMGFVVFSVVMAMVSTAIVRHHRGQEII
jgi:hypothetical protein